MALIKTLNGKTPSFGQDVFLAETATIIGDVRIGDHCSIWYNAVLRGDVHYITIGDYVNVQDGAVIHGSYQKAPVHMGNYITVAHNAVIHGCTIEDHVLVGIGAVILDHAVVGPYTLVAAGAVVKEKSILEPYAVYAGCPARKIANISEELKSDKIERIARNYAMYANWYTSG